MPVCSPTPARQNTLAALDELGVAAFELVVVNLYPFTRDRRLRRQRGRVRRADRHRRAVDGARRREEPPQRRGGRRPARIRRRAGRGAGRRVHARGAEEAGVVGLPAHRRVRRGGRVVDGLGAGARRSAPQPLPAVARRDVAARRGAALRREPASAGRAVPQRRRVAGSGAGRAAARKRDVLQQLHRRRRRMAGRVRPRRDLRGDHQARQPVRHRDLLGLGGRCASQGPRMRSAVAPSAV